MGARKAAAPSRELQHPEFPVGHADYAVLKPVVEALLREAGGIDAFQSEIGGLIRRAIDSVIDTVNTKRFTLAECEQPEKTGLGMKLEIALRAFFNLARGRKLDALIANTEVDIKTTMTGNWMIPPEALDEVCMLVTEDEETENCSVGLFVAKPSNLTVSPNRDRKRSVSRLGRDNVWWLLRNVPYPPNVWKYVPQVQRELIMSSRDGTTRMATLFEELVGVEIPRTMVAEVGDQLDFMRRIRRGGGARDLLSRRGIAILSATTDRELIARLGLPPLKKHHFVSYKPTRADHIELLRARRHID